MLFVSVTEYDEIMCNPANKQNWTVSMQKFETENRGKGQKRGVVGQGEKECLT